MTNVGRFHGGIVLVFGLAICQLAFGQLGASPNREVEIRVVLHTSSVCLGSPTVPAEVIVVNHTGSPVTLDVTNFTMYFGYVALVNTGTMQKRLEGLAVQQDPIGRRTPQNQVELRPREAYVSNFDFPINGPFFKTSGYYRLKVSSSLPVGYESKKENVSASIDSIFEIKPCEK